MRARHRDDPRVRSDEVVAAVVAVAEQLEGMALLDLFEQILQVTEATVRYLHVGLVRFPRKQGLRRVGEELPVREQQRHHRAAAALQRLPGLHNLLWLLLAGRLCCRLRRWRLLCGALLSGLLGAVLLPVCVLARGPILSAALGLRLGARRGLAPHLDHLVDVRTVPASDPELLLEVGPPVLHVVEEKVLGILACVRRILANDVEGLRQALHLGQEVQAALQHVVHAAPLREVLYGVQLLDATPHPEQVALRDVQGHDLLEQIVQRLVGMSHEHDLLVGEIVEQKVHHLHGRVGLARAGRSDHHSEARIHAGADRLDLNRGEAHFVLARLALWVRAHVRELVRRRHNALGGPLAGLSRTLLLELDPERALEVLRDVDVLGVGERLEDVVLVDEGIAEVDLGQLRGQLPILCRTWVAVPEEQVVKPIGHDRVFGAHQASNRVEDRLEIVFLRLPPHDQVEPAVNLALAIGSRFEIGVVLRGIQQYTHDPVVPHGRLPLGGVRVADHVAFLIEQLGDLRPAQRHHAEGLGELADPQVRDLPLEGVVRRRHAEQEDDVVLPELVPLLADVRLETREAQLHLGADLGRHGVAHPGPPHVDDLHALLHRQHHSRPAGELRLAVLVDDRLHPRQLVGQVAADLVRRLEAVQVEVAQQVIVDGQELEVQLRQRQRVVPGVILLGHEVGVPDEVLGWVQGHLLDVVLLQTRPFQTAHQDLGQQVPQPLLFFGLDLFLPLLLGPRGLRVHLLLLRLGPLGGLLRGLGGALHRRERRVLRHIQIAHARAQCPQDLQRQSGEVLDECVPSVQGRHVRHGDLL
mmetsp:Transcript_18248/g.54579  ORF Transcript_18248/g.54579 Transcript_18248/m.54579 type:complete len:811 (+) Transcript_18248:1013-3445(+)